MSGPRITYLSGGVGGARFLHGLAAELDPERLRVIVNTGDDFNHWGLNISPDLDTVMYTLADMVDPQRGWGLLDDSFAAVEMVERYGGDTWFGLGDRDLATHLMRSQWHREGQSLSQITQRLCRGLQVKFQVIPMSDDPAPTLVETVHDGTLSFQRWLVQRRAEPSVRRLHTGGTPRASDEALRALDDCELIILGPSNPYVSIDTILSLPGVRDRVARLPTVAVSPIVGGRAVKGPLAAMIRQLEGKEPSAGAIAEHYGSLVQAMLVERGDEPGVHTIPVRGTSTVMKTRQDSRRLAAEALALAGELLG